MNEILFCFTNEVGIYFKLVPLFLLILSSSLSNSSYWLMKGGVCTGRELWVGDTIFC